MLEYFDAHLLGLTATPVKQTFGFFGGNLVSEYTYSQSVVDGVNVDFDVYRITTKVTKDGSTVDAGSVVPVMNRLTRQQRYQVIDDDLTYSGTQLDRAVTNVAQIRLVLETFRDRLSTEIFPGRSEVPKTLIFCKDDNHAEQVVTLAREVFGWGATGAATPAVLAADLLGSAEPRAASAGRELLVDLVRGACSARAAPAVRQQH